MHLPDKSVAMQGTLRRWAILSLGYFVLVGLMGAFLRLVFWVPVSGFNFKYFLHGHSHLAFLGWVFNALLVALLHAYLPDKVKRFRLMFALLQFTVIGMLISFPLQGYGAVSIAFSSLHIFLSYWFAIAFWKASRSIPAHNLSLKWVRWSLGFMVLSSVGPFALGFIMAKGLAGTNLYQLAIYFYLHFQYDGWFTFAIIGLFFWILEKNAVPFNQRKGKIFFILMAAACMPAYTLSALWTHPPVWIYGIGALSASLQLLALTVFISLLRPIYEELRIKLGNGLFSLFVFAFVAFALKVSMQAFSAIPAIADMAYQVRNFTIGYLHLVFLGFTSVFLIAWFAYTGVLNWQRNTAWWGYRLFLTGLIGSELLVFTQPVLAMLKLGMVPFYFEALFCLSAFMPIGTGVILVSGEKPIEIGEEKGSITSRQQSKPGSVIFN